MVRNSEVVRSSDARRQWHAGQDTFARAKTQRKAQGNPGHTQGLNWTSAIPGKPGRAETRLRCLAPGDRARMGPVRPSVRSSEIQSAFTVGVWTECSVRADSCLWFRISDGSDRWRGVPRSLEHSAQTLGRITLGPCCSLCARGLEQSVAQSPVPSVHGERSRAARIEDPPTAGTALRAGTERTELVTGRDRSLDHSTATLGPGGRTLLARVCDPDNGDPRCNELRALSAFGSSARASLERLGLAWTFA